MERRNDGRNDERKEKHKEGMTEGQGKYSIAPLFQSGAILIYNIYYSLQQTVSQNSLEHFYIIC